MYINYAVKTVSYIWIFNPSFQEIIGLLICWFLKINALKNQGLLQILEKFYVLQTWIFF